MSPLSFDFVYANTQGDFKTVHVQLNVTKEGDLELAIFSDETIADNEVFQVVENLQNHRLKRMNVNLIADAKILLCVKNQQEKELDLKTASNG